MQHLGNKMEMYTSYMHLCWRPCTINCLIYSALFSIVAKYCIYMIKVVELIGENALVCMKLLKKQNKNKTQD